MQTLSATDFVNNFGRRNQEVQLEPIEVKSHGRTVGYYVSPREFQELQAIKGQMRQSYTPDTLPSRYWDAIASEKSSADDTHLDRMLAGKEPRIFFPGDADYPATAAEDDRK